MAKLEGHQREQIIEMLEAGFDKEVIAAEVGVTKAQVAGVAAHLTMGTYEKDDAQHDAPPKTVQLTKGQVGPVIGTDTETGETIRWAPFEARYKNPHMLVVGGSGSGKTYLIQSLVGELAQHAHPSIVLDFGQGFSGELLESVCQVIRVPVAQSGLALNPLDIFPSDVLGPKNAAQRFADTARRVFPRLGIQQHARLRDLVLETFADEGITPDDPDSWLQEPPTLKALRLCLLRRRKASSGAEARNLDALDSHISSLFFYDIFRGDGYPLTWSDLVETDNVTLLRLEGLEASVERLVAEFILWGLWRRIEDLGPSPFRVLLVLDEAHKLPVASGSPVERILREGRKFGLGVLLASQESGDFATVAFGNCETGIVLHSDDRSGVLARYLTRQGIGRSITQVDREIAALPRGVAFAKLPDGVHKVRVWSISERGWAQ